MKTISGNTVNIQQGIIEFNFINNEKQYGIILKSSVKFFLIKIFDGDYHNDGYGILEKKKIKSMSNFSIKTLNGRFNYKSNKCDEVLKSKFNIDNWLKISKELTKVNLTSINYKFKGTLYLSIGKIINYNDFGIELRELTPECIWSTESIRYYYKDIIYISFHGGYENMLCKVSHSNKNFGDVSYDEDLNFQDSLREDKDKSFIELKVKNMGEIMGIVLEVSRSFISLLVIDKSFHCNGLAIIHIPQIYKYRFLINNSFAFHAFQIFPVRTFKNYTFLLIENNFSKAMEKLKKHSSWFCLYLKNHRHMVIGKIIYCTEVNVCIKKISPEGNIDLNTTLYPIKNIYAVTIKGGYVNTLIKYSDITPLNE